MANLIVTIISIALITITSIMALYFIGPGFNEASNKAAANQITNVFKQVAVASQTWAVTRNMASLPDPQTNTPASGSSGYFDATALASFLEPDYMQANTANTLPGELVMYRNAAWISGRTVLMLRGANNRVTEKTCRYMEAMREGTLPAENREISSASELADNATFCGEFGCLSDPDGVIGGGGSYEDQFVPYWRVAGRLNAGQADNQCGMSGGGGGGGGADTTPDAFVVAGCGGTGATNPFLSGATTPTGFDTATTISISCTSCGGGNDAIYRVNGGAFTAGSSPFSPGDSFTVRFNFCSPGLNTATITIGGVAGTCSYTKMGMSTC